MAAALSYQLGIAEQGFTTYGTVMMDEAFVLASEEFAGAGIKALHEFGFQLLLAAPENVIDLSGTSAPSRKSCGTSEPTAPACSRLR